MNTFNKSTATLSSIRSLIATLITCLLSITAVADDTEAYLNHHTLPAAQTRSNIVFILDTSGSMGRSLEGSASYDPDKDYGLNSDPNYSGGLGDSDYYYLYVRPDTEADQYIYYNKVHADQMTCSFSPAKDSGDEFVFESAGEDWLSGDSSSTAMCFESDPDCDFASGPSGPKVDCKDEHNHVNTGDFPASDRDTTLFAVTENYHDYLQTLYRYTALQKVMRDIIGKNHNLNMAFMRFNDDDGAYVFQESILSADDSDDTNANQATLLAAIDRLYVFDDDSPLNESLWEAYRYFNGLAPDYGNDHGVTTGPNPKDPDGPNPAVPTAAFSSGDYNSPIDFACQKNHIILLTDGEANSDGGRNSSMSNSPYKLSCLGNCLDEFAGWVRNDGSDLRDHSALTGIQDIKIHTIGFGTAVNKEWLEDTAANGGGQYKQANTADELSAVFGSLLGGAIYESDTAAAPAVAVNFYSGLQHREELYFALFKPSSSPRWHGNIKKYKLVDGEIVDIDASGHAGSAAVDPDSGHFNETAVSGWTKARDLDGDGDIDDKDFEGIDGNDITVGGFATNLTTPVSRKMLTYTGDAPVHSGIADSAPTAISLNSETLVTTNTAIVADPTLLGSTVVASDISDIISWVRGGTTNVPSTLEAHSAPNYFVADGIHNTPAVVTYSATFVVDPVTGDVTSSTFDDTLFAATNMGTFHAIDVDTGTEVFSFVPKKLLPNLTTYYKDSGGFIDKVYGLDGAMTVWRYDHDKDHNITTGVGSQDHVYIYQPMRRGGSDIYAFDVTNRSNPQLMWQIIGTGLDTTPSGDYRDLAQTWSSPQRATIQWGCSISCQDKEVLFFGGGYDPVHDDATSPVASSQGNAIYMVDAKTSELLWSAGNGSHHDFNNSNLTHSIAADVTPGDIDGDGFVDFLFAVDIQGKVWRFDFNDHATSPGASTQGGIIAELGSTGSNYRRFYNAPDVAFFTERGQSPVLTISLASGHRADPREEDINDRLYVIFDRNVASAPDSYNYVGGSSTIDESDMYAVGSSANAYGWYLPLLGVGEKGLSQTKTFDGKIIMTTFLPAATHSCEGSTGEGRKYILDALTGVSQLTDSSGKLTLYGTVNGGGIPPEPSVFFGSKEICVANCDGPEADRSYRTVSDITVCVGIECDNEDVKLTTTRSYWREN